MDISQKLDRLSELQAAPDAIRLQKQALIDSILTAEIRAKLAEIDAEFAPQLQSAEEAAAILEAEIRAEVVAGGVTVKGAHLMAVWNKGREGGWDGKKLAGYATAHPEILAFKKPDGEPSVSFRNI
jgi:hypothetical protein